MSAVNGSQSATRASDRRSVLFVATTSTGTVRAFSAPNTRLQHGRLRPRCRETYEHDTVGGIDRLRAQHSFKELSRRKLRERLTVNCSTSAIACRTAVTSGDGAPAMSNTVSALFRTRVVNVR